MFYKLVFVALLYFDQRLCFTILSFINPISYFIFDAWQMLRLKRTHKINMDKLYLATHFFADLFLLLNAGFVLLIQCASDMEQGNYLLAHIDSLFLAYRTYLVVFVIYKLLILLIEIPLASKKMSHILKSEEYVNSVAQYIKQYLREDDLGYHLNQHYQIKKIQFDLYHQQISPHKNCDLKA